MNRINIDLSELLTPIRQMREEIQKMNDALKQTIQLQSQMTATMRSGTTDYSTVVRTNRTEQLKELVRKPIELPPQFQPIENKKNITDLTARVKSTKEGFLPPKAPPLPEIKPTVFSVPTSFQKEEIKKEAIELSKPTPVSTYSIPEQKEDKIKEQIKKEAIELSKPTPVSTYSIPEQKEEIRKEDKKREEIQDLKNQIKTLAILRKTETKISQGFTKEEIKELNKPTSLPLYPIPTQKTEVKKEAIELSKEVAALAESRGASLYSFKTKQKTTEAELLGQPIPVQQQEKPQLPLQGPLVPSAPWQIKTQALGLSQAFAGQASFQNDTVAKKEREEAVKLLSNSSNTTAKILLDVSKKIEQERITASETLKRATEAYGRATEEGSKDLAKFAKELDDAAKKFNKVNQKAEQLSVTIEDYIKAGGPSGPGGPGGRGGPPTFFDEWKSASFKDKMLAISGFGLQATGTAFKAYGEYRGFQALGMEQDFSVRMALARDVTAVNQYKTQEYMAQAAPTTGEQFLRTYGNLLTPNKQTFKYLGIANKQSLQKEAEEYTKLDRAAEATRLESERASGVGGVLTSLGGAAFVKFLASEAGQKLLTAQATKAATRTGIGAALGSVIPGFGNLIGGTTGSVVSGALTAHALYQGYQEYKKYEQTSALTRTGLETGGTSFAQQQEMAKYGQEIQKQRETEEKKEAFRQAELNSITARRLSMGIDENLAAMKMRTAATSIVGGRAVTGFEEVTALLQKDEKIQTTRQSFRSELDTIRKKREIELAKKQEELRTVDYFGTRLTREEYTKKTGETAQGFNYLYKQQQESLGLLSQKENERLGRLENNLREQQRIYSEINQNAQQNRPGVAGLLVVQKIKVQEAEKEYAAAQAALIKPKAVTSPWWGGKQEGTAAEPTPPPLSEPAKKAQRMAEQYASLGYTFAEAGALKNTLLAAQENVSGKDLYRAMQLTRAGVGTGEQIASNILGISAVSGKQGDIKQVENIFAKAFEAGLKGAPAIQRFSQAAVEMASAAKLQSATGAAGMLSSLTSAMRGEKGSAQMYLEEARSGLMGLANTTAATTGFMGTLKVLSGAGAGLIMGTGLGLASRSNVLQVQDALQQLSSKDLTGDYTKMTGLAREMVGAQISGGASPAEAIANVRKSLEAQSKTQVAPFAAGLRQRYGKDVLSERQEEARRLIEQSKSKKPAEAAKAKEDLKNLMARFKEETTGMVGLEAEGAAQALLLSGVGTGDFKQGQKILASEKAKGAAAVAADFATKTYKTMLNKTAMEAAGALQRPEVSKKELLDVAQSLNITGKTDEEKIQKLRFAAGLGKDEPVSFAKLTSAMSVLSDQEGIRAQSTVIQDFSDRAVTRLANAMKGNPINQQHNDRPGPNANPVPEKPQQR